MIEPVRAIGSGRGAGLALARLACLVVAGCHPGASSDRPKPVASATAGPRPSAFAGSKACRDCHEHFYDVWASSRHGLAMQPFTTEFARANLTPQATDVALGRREFRVDLAGRLREKGPDGEKTYPIAHVMGGKNVYYFLTPLERGRLQVLPLAYDVRKKTWYDTAASGVRHVPDRRDQALDWTDRLFTFNTTCFNCHVSQLATNYDLETDQYHTTWGEPGISCESCHGPAVEHVRVMEHHPPVGHTSGDIRIIRTREFTTAQMNDMCATCHAKLVPLSTSFRPGDTFFDHFDLVTLEHPDYYPDGRDLGENYTHTSWLQSPCAQAGRLDCNHCHTPSGRPRFEGAMSNRSCLPCHRRHVEDPVAHGHHPAGSPGSRCIACHMPMTRFAAMDRTDHSMRPPAPAATKAFQSPNACNLCHADQTADWADEWARKWYKPDYQEAILAPARLLDAARKGQWKELSAMLAALEKPGADEVWKASMVAVLSGCEDASKVPVFRQLLHDASPLVRSRAATALGERLTPETVPALLEATRDAMRLVRIRAAQALAAVPDRFVTRQQDRSSLDRAVAEFRTAMGARPDDWASHANLGNFALERGDLRTAVAEFEIASRLEPRVVGPLVNAALAYNGLHRNDRAENCLRRALKAEPEDASAHFNLGLLLGEMSRPDEAEQHLRAALKADPQMAAAAYNLGVIVAQRNPAEGISWCRKAHQLAPDDPKYAHTLAFYQRQQGDHAGAVQTLRRWLDHHPRDAEAHLILGQTFEDQGDRASAARAYHAALSAEGLTPEQRAALTEQIRRLQAEH